MDTLIAFLNSGVSGTISILLFVAVLSDKVHDGVVIKFGLICTASGFGAIAVRMLDGFGPSDMGTFVRALLMVNAGVVVVAVGYLTRRFYAKHKLRRAADFVNS